MECYALACFGLQGGGFYIRGTATLINSNVYENAAISKSVCSLFEPDISSIAQMDGTLGPFGLQGGGLFISGTATLTNTNVYSNRAPLVCRA